MRLRTRALDALDETADRALRLRSNPLRLPERPDVADDAERDAAFDRLIATGGRIGYYLPYPRWQLLARAVDAHDMLLHGTTRTGLTRFEPQEQTSYRGRPVTAVFATPDPIWPMFFATLDKTAADAFWNACLLPEESALEQTRYFFSVSGRLPEAWRDGVVYLLPRRTFHVSDAPAEWVSQEPVEPLGALPVSRADFPFADRVFRCVLGAPLWRNMARLAWSGWRPVLSGESRRARPATAPRPRSARGAARPRGRRRRSRAP